MTGSLDQMSVHAALLRTFFKNLEKEMKRELYRRNVHVDISFFFSEENNLHGFDSR